MALLINENKKPSGGPTPPTHANADNESSSSSSSDEDSSSEGEEMAEGESQYQSQYGSTVRKLILGSSELRRGSNNSPYEITYA